MNARERLIVALDETDVGKARDLVARLGDVVGWFKVGMTLYYRAGPAFVDELKLRGAKVFVDLKCHDIPSQVAGAVSGLAGRGADLITVHTAGGAAMLEAAAEAAEGYESAVLGVTVLTSLAPDDLDAVGCDSVPRALVKKRTLLAVAAGLAGVVSSPLEASSLRAVVPVGFEIVTPGVRPAGASLDDQRRTATPADAIRAGASRLVVGRPITRAPDPAAAAADILREIHGALR